MEKLTKLQKNILITVYKKGSKSYTDWYPPIQKLVSIKFVEKDYDKKSYTHNYYRCTEDGKKYIIENKLIAMD